MNLMSKYGAKATISYISVKNLVFWQFLGPRFEGFPTFYNPGGLSSLEAAVGLLMSTYQLGPLADTALNVTVISPVQQCPLLQVRQKEWSSPRLYLFQKSVSVLRGLQLRGNSLFLFWFRQRDNRAETPASPKFLEFVVFLF